MGHIVFAAPSIPRFHLHERLARALRARGHRMSVLTADPAAFTFYSAQAMPTFRLLPGRAQLPAVPLREFAEHDCLRRGAARPTTGRLLAAERRLQRTVGALLRYFETDCPDLVLLHQDRTGLQRLIHFIAREFGCRVLWTGDGLLPGTMQLDEEGIDGASSLCRRSAREYRGFPEDDVLLAAALAAMLGRNRPAPLSRKLLHVPSLRARLADALPAWLGGHHGPFGAVEAWRSAVQPMPLMRAPTEPNLPASPYVAVLLQREDDPRLRIDAPVAGAPASIVHAARAATDALDPSLPLIAVLPEGGLLARELAALSRVPRVILELPQAAPEAVAMAMAVVTVNHPLGVGALLAGTPLLCTGRSPYAVRGIATSTRLDTLIDDLPAALADDQAHLRQRFLTWLLTRGHLWCGCDFPDHNGLTGLVAAVETRLHERGPLGAGLVYRPGPAWPLAAGETP